MLRRTASILLRVVAVLLAGGCGAAIEPINVVADCPGQPVRGPAEFAAVPEVQMISDFETGDAATNPPLNPVGGRDGAWILGTDTTSVSLVNKPSARCVARGRWSGHFSARGFTSWGVNWTAIFRNATGSAALPYDGSKYGGISFWAAFGGQNGPAFDVPVGIATMDTAWNSGGCDVCTDHYMTMVRLTSDWRRYDVRFTDMAQGGRGDPQVAMRRDQMVGFVIWPAQAFDIWVDDVRFEP
jgi:hypothetical protein